MQGESSLSKRLQERAILPKFLGVSNVPSLRVYAFDTMCDISCRTFFLGHVTPSDVSPGLLHRHSW
jgi:hypothetical protein